jgi:prepilin-type N-terminal cleavage/methylation domain-containing protein
MRRKLQALSRERKLGVAVPRLAADGQGHAACGIRQKAYGMRRTASGIGQREVGGRRPEIGGLKVAGFSLVELLVTVAIIAVMSTLLTPAVRGLMGVTGPRGGVNVVSSAIEQARLSAMESGEDSFVGFPFQAASVDEDIRYSSFIVFRRGRPEEKEPTFVPITRWLRLPQGVFVEGDLGQNESPGNTIPKLAGESVSTLSVVRFDSFGRLSPQSKISIRVGEKADPKGDFLGGSQKHFEIALQPLTGRSFVTDKAAEGK